jgi:hypothetical protein
MGQAEGTRGDSSGVVKLDDEQAVVDLVASSVFEAVGSGQ